MKENQQQEPVAMEPSYIIGQSAANAMLQFLVKLPYEQVFQHVEVLRNLRPNIQEPQKSENEK